MGIPTSHDLYLFHEGNLFHSYRIFGAHLLCEDGVDGVRFTVWAPHAHHAAVAGDFNGWKGALHGMERLGDSGLWTLFVPGIGEGTLYKYEITGRDGRQIMKSDPYAFRSELRPQNASVVSDLSGYTWKDDTWLLNRRTADRFSKPMNIYELHLGSWKNCGTECFYSYAEIAEDLVCYMLDMGYTHLELLPVTEHPFDRSWGYQTTGYFCATSRYGHPKELMSLIDTCHQHGIGVILDWVPGHFCKDDHGLRLFDGTPLFEHPDPSISEKVNWGTLAFDFSKPEVVSFLVSSTMFWLEVYHLDGIRVDAVASMMNLNFDKPHHLQIRNPLGGTENLDAIAFLKKLNQAVARFHPDTVMIAEDSSDWPMVTAPVSIGGLGFAYKWNMGWMNDTLRYMRIDPSARRHHHSRLTFSLLYAYSENFILPFSHDEVVHGKRSLLLKMPGDYNQKFANLRLLYGFWMAHPGKKLLFMGGEFAHYEEWKDMEDLDWELLEFEKHRQVQAFVRVLNGIYLREPCLWEKDQSEDGFSWIDVNNAEQSIISFIRRGAAPTDHMIVLCNFSEQAYRDYRIGVPGPGAYREVINSDREEYGGFGLMNPCLITAEEIPMHGRAWSIRLIVPPLSTLWLKNGGKGEK